jgi:aminopeptidase N
MDRQPHRALGGRRVSDPVDPYLPDHGDPDYDVRRYDLELDYRLQSNRLVGRATISCVAVVDLGVVTLDLAGLTASKVWVDGRAPAVYRHRGTRLEVRPKQPIESGTEFTVTVAYHGNPHPTDGAWGEAGWEELVDGVIVAAQPHGAPSWFPCNDRPSNKASYRFALTIPNDYHAVANGTLRSRRQGASATTWVYEMAEPMATYLATVQVGRYVARPLAGSSVPMEVVLPQSRVGDLERGLGRQPDMMRAYVDLFGPYPFPAYRVVVTEDELEIPLEAQGLSIFGSNFLDDAWDAERLVAHELAHQWFGNSVTLREWKDIWLHEGFACYAEWLWSERSGRQSADEHARKHWERLDELPQDLLLGDPGPGDMFDDRVYKRGALLLHALRLALGDDRFFRVLREWVARHRHANASTEDLMALVSEIGDDDLSGLFAVWLHVRSLPALPSR